MATDVHLDAADGTFVVIESRVLKTTASDFMLDSLARRGRRPGHRRALVHDSRDGLTINFANDYTGGVTINGVREINNWLDFGVALNGVKEINALVRSAEQRREGDGETAQPEGLVLRGPIHIQPNPSERSVQADDLGATGAGAATTYVGDTVSLQGVLAELQSEVARLRERIAQLEYGAK